MKPPGPVRQIVFLLWEPDFAVCRGMAPKINAHKDMNQCGIKSSPLKFGLYINLGNKNNLFIFKYLQ
jgi:hypothetical protein